MRIVNDETPSLLDELHTVRETIEEKRAELREVVASREGYRGLGQRWFMLKG